MRRKDRCEEERYKRNPFSWMAGRKEDFFLMIEYSTTSENVQ
jgi:hypothetical protein